MIGPRATIETPEDRTTATMSLAEYATSQGLHRVGARPPLREYLKQAWQRRDFAITMARYKIRSANERNRLGMLWVVLQPMLNALIYGTIFGLLQSRSSRPADFAAFVVVGVFLFSFFSSSLTNGAKAITGNTALVQSLAFPRITLPIAVVIENFLKLLPSLGVMAIIMIVFGHWPTWHWLLMVPLLLLYSMLCTGIALIGARLTVHVRDLTQLLPFISRLFFYTSGVLFQPDKLLSKDHPLLTLFDVHPIYETLALARHFLMDNHRMAHGLVLEYAGFLTLWAVAVFVFGVLFFWAAEERYGRVN